MKILMTSMMLLFTVYCGGVLGGDCKLVEDGAWTCKGSGVCELGKGEATAIELTNIKDRIMVREYQSGRDAQMLCGFSPCAQGSMGGLPASSTVCLVMCVNKGLKCTELNHVLTCQCPNGDSAH